MKVLAFTPQYLPIVGGIEIFVDLLSQSLRQRSIETVVVTTCDRRKQLPERDVVNGAFVYRLDFIRALQLGGAIGPLEVLHRLLRIVETEQPDLLHMHSALCSAPWYLERLLRKLDFRLPLIVTEHTLLQPSECLEVVRRLLLKADAVSAVSRSVLRSVIELTGRKGRSTVIYNGVGERDHETDVLARADRTISRHRLICVGRLEREKGFDLAIAALAKVRFTGLDVELMVIGDGEDRDFLLQVAMDHAITDHVNFTGALDHVSTLAAIAASSLVLIPSRPREGFSLVAVEAARSGVPRVGAAGRIYDNDFVLQPVMGDATGVDYIAHDAEPPFVEAGAPTRLFPATRQEAIRAILPSTIGQLMGGTSASPGLIMELVRSTPAFHLTLGGDFKIVPDTIATQLMAG
jgi:glycogen(starch) synthase